MAKYLISFPSAAMVVPDDEWEAVDRDAHAVIDKAKAAGTATNWRTCQSNGDQNDVQRSLSAGRPPSADSDHYLSELAILPPFRGHFPLWRLDLDDFHILMRFTRSAVCD